MGFPKKKRAAREPAGPPGKHTHTHTPDPRFTLNTHTEKTAGLSLHLSLNFSLRLAPPLSPLRDLPRAIAPVSSHTHTHTQIIASSYSSRGDEQKNSVTCYPHISCLFSHFSSANGVPPPPLLFLIRLLLSLPSPAPSLRNVQSIPPFIPFSSIPFLVFLPHFLLFSHLLHVKFTPFHHSSLYLFSPFSLHFNCISSFIFISLFSISSCTHLTFPPLFYFLSVLPPPLPALPPFLLSPVPLFQFYLSP